MTHVSLFTGIGGLDLAAEWAGFRSVLQVERDPYCLRVLERHYPDVPRITDIREVQADDRWRNPTVVSGGFPCQPFSAAGKRGGQDDDRYLWPEMLRVIRELSPTYIVAENVSGLLSLNDGAEFELVLSDLESAGYEVLPYHYPAASVGAPHKRDRIFIVANSEGDGWITRRAKSEGQCRELRATGSGASSTIMADASSQRRQQDTRSASRHEAAHGRQSYGDHEPAGNGEGKLGAAWKPEPDVGRVATGVPHRVDRLRALGNAVVPQQAYPIFATIARMEQGIEL